MQIQPSPGSVPIPDHERSDRRPLHRGIQRAEHLNPGVASPPLEQAVQAGLLPAHHGRRQHLVHVVHQAGPDTSDNIGGAGLLSLLRVLDVRVPLGVHKKHHASSRRGRHRVPQQPLLRQKQPRRPRPPKQLVRGEERRVDGGVLPPWRVAVRAHVARGGSKIPASEATIPVNHTGQPRHVHAQAGHVGPRGQHAHCLGPAPPLYGFKPRLEVRLVEGAGVGV
mmetsp:Transcript_83088/g.222022  ORF Transcript_83088/g.222022 Transcript_83088/m.222022 type:complete len:223 (+) Transcript_83088:807-1475(+)